MGEWNIYTGVSRSEKPGTLDLTGLSKYDKEDYVPNKAFFSTCPGFTTPVFEPKNVKPIREEGISEEISKQTFEKDRFHDIVQKWAESQNQGDSVSCRGAVWISDTLCVDLNVPLATEQPKLVTNQIFFLGEGLPPFLLTLYKKPADTDKTDAKDKVQSYTVHTARLLTRLLHQFSTYCDFYLLPCTLEVDEFSEQNVQREIQIQKKFSRYVFLGPMELGDFTFCTLVRATRALSSMTYIPSYLQKCTEEIVCVDNIWWKAILRVTEKLSAEEETCYSIDMQGSDGFKVEVAVLEAARRLSFNRPVQIVTGSPTIWECVAKLIETNKKLYDIDLKLEAKPEMGVPSQREGDRQISIQHTQKEDAIQETPETTQALSSSNKPFREDETPELDEGQHSVINKWNQKSLFINGGPGSGKTHTLGCLVAKIQTEKTESRVLVLSCNRRNVSEIKQRLKNIGSKFLTDNDINDPKLPGCHVSTFDSFGGYVLSAEYYEKNLQKKGYTELLEESAKSLSEAHHTRAIRCWDWVIVDEAQDLNFTQSFIVETLQESCEHLVVAGDPRQGLYPHCAWFAKEWSKHLHEESGVVLHYNHRSTPEIVEFLNTYSRENFPNSVHFDQKSSRGGESGTVEWPTIKSPNYGKETGERLVLSEPNDAYAITPVSVNTFKNKCTTNTIRQVVHQQRPELITNVYKNVQADENKPKDSYVIGTSRTLKGTERKRVVVYGLTQPNMNYADKEAYQRSYFVALSRAKDHLHVMFDGTYHKNDPLAYLHDDASFLNVSTISEPMDTTDPDIKYLGDNYTFHDWDRKVIQLEALPPIEIDQKGDDDFVEEYLKTMIAKECCLPQDIKKGAKNPYKFVAEAYSNERGLNWTVSSRLEEATEKHREKCKPYTNRILELMDGESVEWRKTPGLREKVGNWTGTFEFSNSKTGVILLYDDETAFHHRQNAAMTAALWSFDEAYLLNLRTGKAEQVKRVNETELKNLARLKLALEAECLPDGPKITVPDKFVRSFCVAVSMIVDPDTQLVMEIGAVAFSMGGTIRGTYQALLEGVTAEEETTYVASGKSSKQEKPAASESKKSNTPYLAITNVKKLREDQNSRRNEFCRWVDKMSERLCFICSDSSVFKHLKVMRFMANVYAPMKLRMSENVLFKLMSELASDIRSTRNVESSRSKMDSIQTLQDYTTAAFGNRFTYIPGRAFEDAVAMSTLILKTNEVK